MAAIIVSNGNRGLLSDNRVSIPSIKGVPVPNCPENIDWWIRQADEDFDHVVTILAQLEKHGIAWCQWLLKKLMEEVL